jgi:hypothetical protein
MDSVARPGAFRVGLLCSVHRSAAGDRDLLRVEDQGAADRGGSVRHGATAVMGGLVHEGDDRLTVETARVELSPYGGRAWVLASPGLLTLVAPTALTGMWRIRVEDVSGVERIPSGTGPSAGWDGVGGDAPYTVRHDPLRPGHLLVFRKPIRVPLRRRRSFEIKAPVVGPAAGASFERTAPTAADRRRARQLLGCATSLSFAVRDSDALTAVLESAGVTGPATADRAGGA